MRLSKDEFLAVLKHITELVEADDSYGGSLQYEARPEPNYFDVVASYRYGNSLGQGGVIMYNETKDRIL